MRRLRGCIDKSGLNNNVNMSIIAYRADGGQMRARRRDQPRQLRGHVRLRARRAIRNCDARLLSRVDVPPLSLA
jgi:hypothetical protein